MINISKILFCLILLNTNQSLFSFIENHISYEAYKKYCVKYTKNESNFRFVIFRARARKLELRNRINSLKKRFKVGLSRFTDLTQEERSKYINSLDTKTSEKYVPRIKGNFLKDGVQNLKKTPSIKKLRSTTNSLRARLRRFWNDLKNRIRRRNDRFLSTFITTNSREKNWVTLKKVTSVKNQGECGSCWAFAVAAAVESLYLIENNTTLNLAEQELVDCAKDMDCEGGWNDLAIEYIVENGISLETDYPYEEKNGTCSVPGTATTTNIKEYKKVPASDMEVFLKVLDVQPIAVAVQVEDDFLDYKSGIIDADELCGTTRSVNHAVLAVGYFIASNLNDNYILFKNQWGEEWGDGGYFKFKFYDDKIDDGPCNILKYTDHTVYPVL